MAKKPNKPTVIVQHDYISVNLGNNRRLTWGRSGDKFAGKMPDHVMDAWTKLRDEKSDKKLDVRAQEFADNIDKLWPEWNVPPKTYAVKQQVQYDFGKRRGGMDTGTVESVRGTSVTVRWARNGLVGVTADMLDEYNK